jgi:hypothetical protein
MCKKIIWLVVVIEVVISWPLSMLKKPAHFNKELIFYPETSDESWDFEKKLALDTSKFKRFYYNKTTVIKNRYFKNMMVMMDLNNYFFAMHPREDVSGVDYRFKYPFSTILFLVLAIKMTVKNKKYLKIWGVFLLLVLLLSFLKQFDGWDLILFFPISYLLIIGSKELNRWKFGYLVNLILIILMAVEIGRMFI